MNKAHINKTPNNKPMLHSGDQPGTRELVILVAGLWALNAFAIDMMLPALGIISHDLGAQKNNDQQLMIVVYVVFNGIAQLVFGPLVDRLGRRTVMLWSMGAYVFFSLLSVLASGFNLMLVARAMQGATTAGTRVAANAVIRDRFAGREMAKVMSLVITIFMAAPIIAPGIGQLILAIGPWRWVFVFLMVYGAILWLWVLFRLPETLEPEKKVMLKPALIVKNYLFFFKNRYSAGYTIAGAFVFGALFSFLSASEQIYAETFRVGDYFFLFFGMIALGLALATVTNSRLVNRYGMRRIGHIALFGFIICGVVHYLVFLAGLETLWVFQFFMMISFFTIGMIGPNFGAIAMEPMGKIAGIAAAANGFAGTTVSGILGGLIASFYDGTPTAIIIGYVILGILALITIAIVERGKLFEPAQREL